MPLRGGGSASTPKPPWTPETATRPPSNGELLATRLIEFLLVYCFAPFNLQSFAFNQASQAVLRSNKLSSPHKHYIDWLQARLGDRNI